MHYSAETIVESTLTDSTLELLRHVSLFSRLEDPDLQALAELLRPTVVQPGTILFRRGQPGEELFVVGSGEVRISVTDDIGQEITLMVARHGDLFGELAVLDQGGRAADAVVIEEATLWVLTRDQLLAYLRPRPEVALALMAVLAQRLRATDLLLQSRVARNPNQVVAESESLIHRVANKIADYSGSIQFFFLNMAIFFIWIVVNLGLVPFVTPFDPYPFGFLTMSVSLEAIFLSVLVLLSQNLQAVKDRVRGDIEYEVNLKAELEVAELHRKLDIFRQETLHRLEHMGRAP
jgi:uncharacterized membrane protein